jgi:hypothetical protein
LTVETFNIQNYKLYFSNFFSDKLNHNKIYDIFKNSLNKTKKTKVTQKINVDNFKNVEGVVN